MTPFPLKPASAYVKNYYAALERFHMHGHATEGNTRSALADLLKRCAGPYDWHLVEEYQFKGTGKQSLRADGALVKVLDLSLKRRQLYEVAWETRSFRSPRKSLIFLRSINPAVSSIVVRSQLAAVSSRICTALFSLRIIGPEFAWGR